MALRLNGSSSGYVELDVPAAAGSHTLTLPDGGGSSGQYLQTNGSGVLSWAGAGKVLQVVQTTKTDTYTTNSGTWATPTGLSVNITPSTTSSKILIFATVTLAGQTAATTAMARIRRGSDAIYVGDQGQASTERSYGQFYNEDSPYHSVPIVGIYLDSPGVDTQITYDIQVKSQNSGATVYVNRTQGDRNSASDSRTASSITVMEVAA